MSLDYIFYKYIRLFIFGFNLRFDRPRTAGHPFATSMATKSLHWLYAFFSLLGLRN